ncbi:hypothetical protein [Glaciihabitans sp. dw_435]|uniref:hypothetical protein n=1 Tax=Glaciihabitans sp. dw_435 TaxID=2720081 RepID=UPI001BD6901C|nr:hypothetical protein [Glaciihabitans sp. dw_435]
MSSESHANAARPSSVHPSSVHAAPVHLPQGTGRGTTQQRWRIALIVGGLLLMGIGGITLLGDVPAKNYLGIAVWFVGALILHDGILAPIIFGISLLLRRSSKRVPFGVLLIVQGAAIIAAITTAIVVPAALKKGIGTANSTLLPLDYGVHLLEFYGVLVVVTAVVIAVYLRVTAKRRAAAK